MTDRTRRLAVRIASAAVIAALAAFAWRGVFGRPAIVRLGWRGQRDSVRALGDLIRANGIAEDALPGEHSDRPGAPFAERILHIRIEDRWDKDRNLFRMAVAVYRSHVGSPAHFFIFDRRGTCLLHGEEHRAVGFSPFGDITGEGFVETIAAEPDGEGFRKDFAIARLYRILPDGARVLAAVRLRAMRPLAPPKQYNRDFAWRLGARPKGPGPWSLTLEDVSGKNPPVALTWNRASQRLDTDAPPTDEWQLVSPSADENLR